jgi:hypothetical protein
MSELSGALGMWVRVPFPAINSSQGEIRDIRAAMILFDSQFAEWLAGGRRTDGEGFEWLQTEIALLLERIGRCRAPVGDAGQVLALEEYAQRMKRILGGDDSGFRV